MIILPGLCTGSKSIEICSWFDKTYDNVFQGGTQNRLANINFEISNFRHTLLTKLEEIVLKPVKLECNKIK